MPNKVPISSQIAEKMKSLSTTGILPGIPLVNPPPRNPHVVIANKDCVIWYPVFPASVHGSSHVDTRTLTCPNKLYAMIEAKAIAPKPAANSKKLLVVI